jgi:hypothetical protein
MPLLDQLPSPEVARPVPDDHEQPGRKLFQVDAFEAAMQFQKGLCSEVLGDVAPADDRLRKSKHGGEMAAVGALKALHGDYAAGRVSGTRRARRSSSSVRQTSTSRRTSRADFDADQVGAGRWRITSGHSALDGPGLRFACERLVVFRHLDEAMEAQHKAERLIANAHRLLADADSLLKDADRLLRHAMDTGVRGSPKAGLVRGSSDR